MTCREPTEQDDAPSISLSLPQIRFCKTFLMSGGFSTLENEPEEKDVYFIYGNRAESVR